MSVAERIREDASVAAEVSVFERTCTSLSRGFVDIREIGGFSMTFVEQLCSSLRLTIVFKVSG